MTSDLRLASIPRGDTCKGVNVLVVRMLLAEFEGRRLNRLFDVPCGRGELLDAVRIFFPHATTVGGDIAEPANGFGHAFVTFDAENPPSMADETFDAVTCVSGVMMFDNTLTFLRSVRRMIAEDGVFVVTNDNVLSVRDRLLYLFGGRFGQFPFRTTREGAVWKILHPQNLIQLLGEAGFTVDRFEYVPILGGNWLWAVLATPLFLIQRTVGAGGSNSLERQVFNLRSFMSRHYVIVCHPTPARER